MSNEADYAPSEMEPADENFAKSDAHAIGELELQQYTPSRVVAAQSMGLKYPHLSAEDREQFDKTSIYPGALQDIAIVLWLCSLADDPPDAKAKEAGTWLSGKMKVRRALRLPMEALETAIEWATARGYLNTKQKAFWTAYDTAMGIINESLAAVSVPTDSANGSAPDPK